MNFNQHLKANHYEAYLKINNIVISIYRSIPSLNQIVSDSSTVLSIYLDGSLLLLTNYNLHFSICLRLESKDVNRNINAILNNDFVYERDFSNSTKVMEVQGLGCCLFDRNASHEIIIISLSTKFSKLTLV